MRISIFSFTGVVRLLPFFSFRITFINTAETKSGIFNMVARKSIFVVVVFYHEMFFLALFSYQAKYIFFQY